MPRRVPSIIAVFTLLLFAGPAAAQVPHADLIGKWSADCDKAHIEIFERNGVLMQQGFVSMTEFPVPPDLLPPAPVVVKASGDRLVLMSKVPFGQVTVRTMVRAVRRGSRTLQIVDLLGCMGDDCQTLALNQPVVRCD